MNEEPSKELPPETLKALRSLRSEQTPPTDLEDKTVRVLQEKDLISTGTGIRSRRVLASILSTAAAVIFFVLGFGFGSLEQSPTDPRTDDEQYLLVLLETQAVVETGIPESELIDEYSEWARALGEEGTLLDGEKLEDTIRLLRQSPGGVVVESSKIADHKIAIGGYFVIQAGSYDKATQIAASCPHLKYGGSIELRKIEQL